MRSFFPPFLADLKADGLTAKGFAVICGHEPDFTVWIIIFVEVQLVKLASKDGLVYVSDFF